MDSDAQKGLEHLEEIEGKLEDIKHRTSNFPRAFLSGMLSGAGAIVGSIGAIILIGWVLSLLGVIPGFGWIADYLRGVVENLKR